MPRKTSLKKSLKNSAATVAALRKREKQKRPLEPDAWLYTREQATRLLNVSIATLIRLENAGSLRAIKLSPEKPNAQTFYKRDDLLVLASGR